MKLSDIHDNKLRERILRADREQNAGRRNILGGLEAGQPKPTASPALAGRASKRAVCEKGVEIVVTFTAHRKRLLDKDNNTASFKPLQDALARDIGLDDGDSRFNWQYSQIKTEGREGVVVTVEKL
jgi:hypothetical protein